MLKKNYFNFLFNMNSFNVANYNMNDFLNLLVLLIISILLACLLMLFSFNFVHQKPDSEKLSIYECGYEPYENSRYNFNTQFYLIAIFFIIFDIEILFVIPWCLLLSKTSFLSFWSMIDFIFELNLGFFYVWYNNSLNWE